jgi:hypothetical protein
VFNDGGDVREAGGTAYPTVGTVLPHRHLTRELRLRRPRTTRGLVAAVLAFGLLLQPTLTASASTAPTGAVTGRVLDHHGEAIAGTTVTVFDPADREVASESTSEDGRFTLALPPADYTLHFSDPGSAYVGQWYPEVGSRDEAETLHLETGTRDLGDTTLWPATVAGQVRAPDGGGFAEVDAELLRPTGELVRKVRVYNGKPFDLGRASPGEYVVRVTATGLIPEAAVVKEVAVTVGIGHDSSALSLVVPRGATVSGRVTPTPAEPWRFTILVRYPTAKGYAQTGGSMLEDDGTYEISGLPSGGVKVRVHDETGESATHWYGGSGDPLTATTVPTEAGTVTSGIDFELRPGASITGRVTDPDGGVDTHASVYVFPLTSDKETVARMAVRDGEYIIRGLAAGDYKVAFMPGNNYVPSWSGGAATYQDAALIHLEEGQELTGLDAALEPGASLDGTIENLNRDRGTVEALPVDGGPPAGRYNPYSDYRILDQLPAGTYRLRVVTRFTEQVLPDTLTFARGEQVTGYTAELITCRPPSVADTEGRTIPAVGREAEAGAATWSEAPESESYQWFRDGEPVSGATGTTYVPKADDRGHRLSVRVHATFPSREVSCTSKPTEPVRDAPVATAPPVLSGLPHAGETLSVGGDSWEPTPDAVRHEWYSDGILVATNSSQYVVPETYSGRTLQVRAIATLPGYAEGIAFTDEVTILRPPLSGASPTIRGRAKVGRTLRVRGAYDWTPTADEVRFRWLRAGRPIPGATSRTYTARVADIGKRLRVRVIALREGYQRGVVTTSPTRRVVRSSSIELSGRSPRKGVAVLVARVKVSGTSDPRGCVVFHRGRRTSPCRDLRDGVARHRFHSVASGPRRFRATYDGWGPMTRVADRIRLRVR